MVRVPQKLQPALPAILMTEAKVLRVVDVVRQGRDLHQIAMPSRSSGRWTATPGSTSPWTSSAASAQENARPGE